MISQAAEYALRAVVCLAEQRGRAVTTQQIAQGTGVPPGYLAKVMQALVRATIVSSHRGLKGGFELARDPGCLTLLDVVRAIDRSRRIDRCPLGIESHNGNLCTLHRRLDAAAAVVEEMLGGSTITQLLADPSGARPLCGYPHASPPPKTEVPSD